MSDIKIEDDYLPSYEFGLVRNLFAADRKRKIRYNDKEIGFISWNFSQIENPHLGRKISYDNYQLCHQIYFPSPPGMGSEPKVESSAYCIIPLFFNRIRSICIKRIKANLLMRTSEIIPHTFHTDYYVDNEVYPDIVWSGLKTSIYYINSNDGYTEFEDGTRIESVANRLVTFPNHMKHRGTTCTNKPFRMVINFNYF
mgnify:CR=1 FL=1